MCIETIGFIPFIPGKPAPISAYTVLRAVCILSGTTSFTPNKIYEENKIGCHIGSIFCGVPTVADDVTLIANDPHDLQTMLNIQKDHANKHRYIISDQKSCVLKIRDKTLGFIPFIPCKPASISAYTVLRAVCILSGATSFTPNFEEVSLLIPK
jgi:enamine deaminase RidA (YjgF/YER057c/UK114 family)